MALLPTGHVVYCPEVMTTEAIATLERELFKGNAALKDKYAIPVSKELAEAFCCNLVTIGSRDLFVQPPVEGQIYSREGRGLEGAKDDFSSFKDKLETIGFKVYEINTALMNLSGGGLHCMINKQNHPVLDSRKKTLSQEIRDFLLVEPSLNGREVQDIARKHKVSDEEVLEMYATVEEVMNEAAVKIQKSFKARKKFNSSSVVATLRPSNFTVNPQTAVDNSFQVIPEDDDISTRAREEHDNFVHILREVVGVGVLVINQDTPDTPDAVFLNNWFSTHSASKGREAHAFLYPMKHPNRRGERRLEFVTALQDLYNEGEVTDLSASESIEEEPRFLEGTGSMVFDRPNGKVYASISERCDLEEIQRFTDSEGLELISFRSKDQNEDIIYHTNVMMWVGTNVMAVCKDSICGESKKEEVISNGEADGKLVLELSQEEVAKFAGNAFEVIGHCNKPYLVMSEVAKNGLTEVNLKALEDVYGKGRVVAYTIFYYRAGRWLY